jgi:hypothetical protein|uniref:Uncharacterized protein n=1 Tax=viral metagenome TaxID=1070528 RepID=A0A6C0BLR5_9ZZZZ
MSASLIDPIVTMIMATLQKTRWGGESLDISQIKQIVESQLTQTLSRLDKTDEKKILTFVQNKPLLNECILPNLEKIVADGKIALDDIPAFMSILVGLYQDLSVFLKGNRVVKISTNDIIELSGFLVKVMVIVLIRDASQIAMVNSLLDVSLKMLRVVIKTKTFSCKCCSSC